MRGQRDESSVGAMIEGLNSALVIEANNEVWTDDGRDGGLKCDDDGDTDKDDDAWKVSVVVVGHVRGGRVSVESR